MRSIRRYLLFALLATITLGIFLAVLGGYQNGLDQTLRLMDLQLADSGRLLRLLDVGASPVLDTRSDRLVFQVWDENGQLTLRSSNAPLTPLASFTEGYSDTSFHGRRWRVLGQPDTSSGRWILVAEPLDLRYEIADGIVLKSLRPFALVLPLIALLVWLIVGSGLAVLRRLAAELAGKRADDLSSLARQNPPIELVPVVEAVNGLLGRLAAAVQRERQFSSDAAHELRTPLSALAIHIHNLKSELPDAAEKLAVLDDDLHRLSHLIEQILQLYRMTPENFLAQRVELDVHALVQQTISDLFEEIQQRHQTIELSGGQQWILGNTEALAIMLGNILRNASRYTPEGGSISVTVERFYRAVRINVSDTGPGIPLADLNRVVDRFYRVGGDRHASPAPGCGLGLPIAVHIAKLHDAELTLCNNDDGPGLTVSVIFADERDDAPGSGDDPE